MRMWVGLCLVFSALLASHAMAHTATGGSIRGYVKDEQDAVLRGVTLSAISPDAPDAHVVTSDDAGYYRLLDLVPGTYTVRAERDGFATWVRESIVVRAGLNLNVPIVMKLGSRSETVQVIAETPLLESRSATQAVNVSGDLQRDVPLSGRKNWADSLLLVPGVVSQETINNTQWFFAHGAEQNANTFQIDGADAASSFSNGPQYISLSTEAIQDVSIKSGSIDAATPLGLGAAISVTTKEGTNHMRGTASLTYRARSWNGNNVPGGTAAAIAFAQPEAVVGGPLVPDRAWFLGSYRRIGASTGVSRTAKQIATLQLLAPGFTPFDLKNTGNLYFVKSSIALAPRHRLSASYHRDPNGTDFGSSDAAIPSRSILGGNSTAVRLQSVWNAAFLTEAAVSYNDRSQETQVQNTDEPQRIAFQTAAVSGGRLTGFGRLAAYGASGTTTRAFPSQKLTISADAKMFKRGWSGSHEFQAGLFLQPKLTQRTTLDYVNGGAVVEDLVLLDPQDPSKGTRIFHTQTFEKAHQVAGDLDGSNLAFYVQDSWNPTKSLTASIGVRVDVIRRTDRIFDVPTQRSRDIGPRVGLTYAVTGDGKTVARLSWSRVHETPAMNWISPGSSAAGWTDRFDMNADGVLETTLVTPGSTALNPRLFIDVDHYHQPRADQWNAGLRRQLPGHIVADVGFISRALRDGTAFLETNAIYDGVTFKGFRNDSLPRIFQVTNNRWNWQVVRELELSVTKQTERVQMIGTYSRQWRHLAGTWQPNDSASIIQPSAFANNRGIGRQNDSGGLNQDGLSGSALTEYIGPAAQWRDHAARLGVSYRATWGMTLAANTNFQSGPWSGPVVTRLPALDPVYGPATITLSTGLTAPNPIATFFRFVGPTRRDGQFTLPNYFALNLRAGKTIGVAAAKVHVAIEAFNVTNHDTPQQLLTSGNQVGNANYRRGTAIQLPRSMQLSIRATF